MIMAGTVWLGVAGMASLSMAMQRHHEQIWGRVPQKAWWGRTLRVAGWLLLIVAGAITVRKEGASMGLTLWTMEISLAAVCVGLLLSYAPRWLPWLAAVALALSGATF